MSGTAGKKRPQKDFYKNGFYKDVMDFRHVEYTENPISPLNINRVFCKSSENMSELPDCSVHLVVTSPPYNVGKEYDDDLSLSEYKGLLRRVFSEVYRVLVPGGRACVNIANIGRKPYIPLSHHIYDIVLSMNFLARGEIIWNKQTFHLRSTCWGSYRSASNPVLRDTHEYILVFCKDVFTRPNPLKRESTITKDEFLKSTSTIWEFPPEIASKIGHPAPFPIELPYRLIQLYTFADEVVLDPFAGSGTTCIASLKAGRKYIAYEMNRKYFLLAERRIRRYAQELKLPM